jgi:hypothetical protein
MGMTLANRWQRGVLVLAATVALACGLMVLRTVLAAPSPALPRPASVLDRPLEPTRTAPAGGTAPAGTQSVETGAYARAVPATPVQVRRVDPTPAARLPAPAAAQPAPAPVNVPANPGAASAPVQAQPLPTVSAPGPATRGRGIASVAPPDSDKYDRP